MFSLIILGFGLLLVWRFVWPLPWPKWARIALASVLLLGSQWPRIQLWIFGTMFSPEFPRPIVIALGWLFCAFIMLLLLTVLMDLIGFVVWALRGRRSLTPAMRGMVRYGVAFVTIALTTFGVQQALKVPDVKRVEMLIPGLPAELDGYRLVQMTDLHISRMFEEPWTRAVVDKANALNADVILITGDLIDGTVDARVRDVAPLADLRAREGVIVSPGNHEYYFDGPAWFAKFEQLGMRMLINQQERIAGGRLTVAGLADDAAVDRGLPGPNLNAALGTAGASDTVVLMAHRPKDGVPNGDPRVDLQLSGHTHGGLIRGVDELFVAPANGGYVSGLYDVGVTQIYVSNGTGLWNGFPIRLGVPAEITEFTLRQAASP